MFEKYLEKNTLEKNAYIMHLQVSFATLFDVSPFSERWSETVVGIIALKFFWDSIFWNNLQHLDFQFPSLQFKIILFKNIIKLSWLIPEYEDAAA